MNAQYALALRAALGVPSLRSVQLLQTLRKDGSWKADVWLMMACTEAANDAAAWHALSLWIKHDLLDIVEPHWPSCYATTASALSVLRRTPVTQVAHAILAWLHVACKQLESPAEQLRPVLPRLLKAIASVIEEPRWALVGLGLVLDCSPELAGIDVAGTVAAHARHCSSLSWTQEAVTKYEQLPEDPCAASYYRIAVKVCEARGCSLPQPAAERQPVQRARAAAAASLQVSEDPHASPRDVPMQHHIDAASVETDDLEC